MLEDICMLDFTFDDGQQSVGSKLGLEGVCKDNTFH